MVTFLNEILITRNGAERRKGAKECSTCDSDTSLPNHGPNGLEDSLPLFRFLCLIIFSRHLSLLRSRVCLSVNFALSSLSMNPSTTRSRALHSPSWVERYLKYLCSGVRTRNHRDCTQSLTSHCEMTEDHRHREQYNLVCRWRHVREEATSP